MNQEPERTSHTPGPWDVEEEDDGSFLVRASKNDDIRLGSVIAIIQPNWFIPDSLADNANLIAAAPDMLEELERLASVFFNAGDRENWRSVKLVIKKAHGE